MDKIDITNYIVDTDLKKQIKSLEAKIKEDTEVFELIKSWGVNDKLLLNNISKFSDFQEDYNYCKKCPGFDKCEKSNPHMSLSLDIDGNYVSRNYSPCKIITARIVKNSLYLYSDFPEQWKEVSYDAIDKPVTRVKIAYQFSKIIDGTSKNWFYLYGPAKSGKSYFSAVLMNEYITKTKQQAAYIDITKRMKQLADLYYSDKNNYEKMFNNLANVSLLIIDNFGSEYKNEFTRDSILIPLLRERSNSNLVTIFVSGFSLDYSGIERLYSLNEWGNSSIVAHSLLDLIKASTTKDTIFKIETIKGLYK